MGNIFRYVVIFIVSAAAYSAYPNVKWHVEVVDPVGGGYASLVLDSSGNPWIVYDRYIEWPYYQLRLAHFNGSTWEIIEGPEVYELVSLSSDIDDGDWIHFTYGRIDQVRTYGSYKPSFDYYLGYCVYNGVDWLFDYIDTGLEGSIALDENGNPHIAYVYCTGGMIPDYWPMYVYYDGSDWYSAMAPWGINNPSLFIDVNGGRYIASSDIHCLSYAYYDDGDWVKETVEEYEGPERPSLALDDEGEAHISYVHEYPDYDAIKYAYENGGGWDVEIIEELEGLSLYSSLVLDSNGNPHVVYVNDDNNQLKYAFTNGGTWETEIISSNCGGFSQSSIAVDSFDYPRIAFRSYAGLAYAWYGSAVDVELTDFSACPTPDGDIVIEWVIEATEGESIAGFNLFRREMVAVETRKVTRTGDSIHTLADNWTKLNDALITGENPYAYIDAGVEPGVTYEYKLEAVVDGRAETLGTTTGAAGARPAAFALYQSRPNPARGDAVISFELPEDADVTLSVYDLSGRRVATLADGLLPAGGHEKAVSGLAPGVYMYRLDAGGFIAVEKMVVIE